MLKGEIKMEIKREVKEKVDEVISDLEGIIYEAENEGFFSIDDLKPLVDSLKGIFPIEQKPVERESIIDNGKIDHSRVDELWSNSMRTLDSWINSWNVQRWYWTTTRAVVLNIAYELICEIEKCGEDAHAAAFMLKGRLDYGMTFVGRGTVGWSFRQLATATGHESPRSELAFNEEEHVERVWILSHYHGGIPELFAYFTKNACLHAWNKCWDDMEWWNGDDENVSSEEAWNDGWCQRHKVEMRWEELTVERSVVE